MDASPDTEKALTDELEKLARVYGVTGADFTKFPTFNFAGNYSYFCCADLRSECYLFAALCCTYSTFYCTCHNLVGSCYRRLY